MLATLDHMQQRWGSAEGYLVAHGLVAGEIDELRECLLEAVDEG
jgi:hypothetical protein